MVGDLFLRGTREAITIARQVGVPGETGLGGFIPISIWK